MNGWIRNVDCAEGLAGVSDESVDVIFTDPPHSSEYLDCYRVLGKEAARVLRPSGFLVAYAGQCHLDRIMAVLGGAGLEWYWMAGQFYVHAALEVSQRMIATSWKPILVFQKPPTRACRRALGDAIGEAWCPAGSPGDQAITNALHVLSRLSRPGDVVLDPFAGLGTHLEAVTRLGEGRRYMGFEADPDAYRIAVSRLEQGSFAGRAVAEVSV